MPNERRIQVRFPENLATKVHDLAKHWTSIGKELTPSEVIRECVERVHTFEFKAKAKEKIRVRVATED